MTTESKSTFLTVVGEGTLIVRHIPDDIRRAFKAKCAMDGKSQQQRVIELIEEDLKGGKGK
jgi:plasmid stability protein